MFYVLLFLVLRKWIVFAMLNVVGNNSRNISINSVEFDGANVPKHPKRRTEKDGNVAIDLILAFQLKSK